MPYRIIRTILPVCLLVSMLGGCGDPCLDDGPPVGKCTNNQASGSETTATATAGSETADSSMTNSESGTASNTGDGDGDPATGDGDGDGDPSTGPGDGDGDDPCANGMQDPGEADIDCGGDCIEVNPDNPNDIEGQCPEGSLCDINEDCVAGLCDDGTCEVCPGDPPAFDPIDLGYNQCQSCLLSNCCDAVLDCFTNIEKCVCWFNCVEHTGLTQQCMDECGNGNIGTINSCMNNACKAEGNVQNCAAP